MAQELPDSTWYLRALPGRISIPYMLNCGNERCGRVLNINRVITTNKNVHRTIGGIHATTHYGAQRGVVICKECRWRCRIVLGAGVSRMGMYALYQ